MNLRSLRRTFHPRLCIPAQETARAPDPDHHKAAVSTRYRSFLIHFRARKPKIQEKDLTKPACCEYNRTIKIYHLHWRFRNIPVNALMFQRAISPFCQASGWHASSRLCILALAFCAVLHPVFSAGPCRALHGSVVSHRQSRIRWSGFQPNPPAYGRGVRMIRRFGNPAHFRSRNA